MLIAGDVPTASSLSIAFAVNEYVPAVNPDNEAVYGAVVSSLILAAPL